MKEQPEVVIMGEEVSRPKEHYHHPGDVIWGLLLITLGILLLFNTIGVVPWEIWNELIRFWPLLLVLAGLKIILGNFILSRLITTLIAASLLGFAVVASLRLTAPELIPVLPPQVETLISWWEEARR